MLDEGMNGIMSAIAEVRAIDGRIADVRRGKTKLMRHRAKPSIRWVADPRRTERLPWSAACRIPT
jgi:hypothetical protein